MSPLYLLLVAIVVGVPSLFLTIRYTLSLIFALIVYLRDGKEALKDVQPIVDAGKGIGALPQSPVMLGTELAQRLRLLPQPTPTDAAGSSPPPAIESAPATPAFEAGPDPATNQAAA